jgi:hypothetical protein
MDSRMSMASLPRIGGKYASDEATLRNHSSDFGGIIRKSPSVVAYPSNAADVSAVIRYAKATGTLVSLRGQGHSMEGQSLVRDGMMIVTESLRLPGEVRISADRGSATVGSGSRWVNVVEVLARHGLRMPVLPDFLGMTVGGTLSAAGIGKGSHEFGTQLDLVIGLVVALGTGEIMECGRDNHCELFRAILGGMGQLGIIIQATLQILPLEPWVAQSIEVVQDPTRLIPLLETASGAGALGVSAQNVFSKGQGRRGWILVNSKATGERGTHGEPVSTRHRILPYTSYVNQIEADPVMRRRFSPDLNAGGACMDPLLGRVSQPWFDAFLSRAGLERFLDSFEFPGLAPSSSMVLIPIRVMDFQCSASLFQYPDGLATGSLFYGVVIIQSTSGTDDVNAALARNDSLLERVFDLGGRNYVIDNILNPRHWRRHLGAEVLDCWRSLKRECDPSGVFSGIGIPSGPEA